MNTFPRLFSVLALASALSLAILANPSPASAVEAAADTTAPGAPAGLAGFPSTLTASDQFTVFWNNPTPADPSGIAAAWYRFDTAPTSDTDGTRIAGVTDPATPDIGVIQELSTGGRTTRTLYLWLEDGVGNIDFSTALDTVLRPEGAPEDFLRVAGADRYETARETSKKIFPVDQSADAVLFANGTAYADALAAVPLAFTANGPILLSRRFDIPQVSFDELKRVLPDGGKIYLLGGTGVLDQNQENFWRDAGYDVERLAGPHRMGTSVKIMEELDALRGTPPDHIYLVNGYAPADALSAAPLAAFLQDGIALTEARDLSQVIRDYANVNLATLTSVTIVGGTAVVPTNVANLFTNSGYAVDRVGGEDRYHTSRMLADMYLDDVPLAPPGVAIANGTAFSDALAGGVHAAAQLYPMLLVRKDGSVNGCERTLDFLQDNANRIQGGYIYGGEAVVLGSSEAMMEQMISGALNFGCPV